MSQGKSKLLEGIIIGAIAGAAISMLDKNTRRTVIENSKAVKNKTVHMIKHPDEVKQNLQEKYAAVRETIEQVSDDVSFLTTQVEQLKKTTPQVLDVVKTTKETFSHKYSQDEQK